MVIAERIPTIDGKSLKEYKFKCLLKDLKSQIFI